MENLVMVAVQERANPVAIGMLLQHRFLQDDESPFAHDVDETGSTALHYWASNQWSLVINDSSIVGDSYLSGERSLLGDDFADREFGARPELGVFNVLVEAWPECVSLRNRQDLSFVELLVTSNCSMLVWKQVLKRVPEALSWKKSNGDTLLHLACTHAHIPSMCERKIMSADSSEFARSALSTSTNYERCQIVNWLLDNVPGAAAVPNAKGHLPLHFAAGYHCDPVIVRMLIASYPEALSRADENGYMPLHLAVKWSGSLFSSNTEVVAMMAAKQTDLTARNKFGNGFLVCSMPETLSRLDTNNLLGMDLDSAADRSRQMQVDSYSRESALNNCPHRQPRIDMYFTLIKLHPGALDEKQPDGRDIFHHMLDRFLKSMLTPFFGYSYLHYVLFCAACVKCLADCPTAGRRELYICKSLVGCLDDARRAMRKDVNRVSTAIQADFSKNIESVVLIVQGIQDKVIADELVGKEETARLCASELLLEEEEKTKSLGAKMAKDSERRRRDKERRKNGKNEAAEAVRLLEERRLDSESVARSQRVQEGVRLRKIRADKELEAREQREAEEAVDRQEREEEARLVESIAAERRRVAAAADTRARQVLQEAEAAEALAQRKLDIDAKLRLRVQEEEAEMQRVDDAALAAQTALQKKKKNKPKQPKKAVRPAAEVAEAGARSLSPVLPPHVEWNPVLHIAMESAAAASGPTQLECKHRAEMLALRRKIELEMQVDKECVVCLDSIRCMALAPCGHIALCLECSQTLMLKTVKLCPTCRDPVSSVLRVY